MPIKINYLEKKQNKSASSLVLFCDEKFRNKDLKKHLSKLEFLYVNDVLKTSDLKKNLLVFK